MKQSGRNCAFLVLFFCSGATALVYEVIWSKFLSQMFGSTIYAQTVVLAVFMGGLALGNALVGRISDRLRNQVRAYGYLELLIGIYAFFFATLYGWADQFFIAAGSKVLAYRWLLLPLKGVLSVALLLVPTVFMGGTLPLLAAWLQTQADKESDEAGRYSARFYAINSLGAVFGAAMAGFYLVRQWGLVASLQWAAMVNLLIGGIAVVLSRGAAEVFTKIVIGSVIQAPETPPPPKSYLWASLLVALTGGISMGLEVLASRSLALIFGSSLQSFAVVLIAFILGIGLGSTFVSSRKLRRLKTETCAAVLLVAAAGWVGFLVYNIESWAYFYRLGRTGLANSGVGYWYHQFFTTFFSVVVLGVPAAFIGSVLPLLIRTVSQEATELGAQVGRLLTWNTLGAVGGVLLTGFVLMPTCGLRNSFVILALGLAAGALVVTIRKRLFLPAGFSAAAGVLLSLLFVYGDAGWRHVLVSGIFRSRDTLDLELMGLRKSHLKLLFYEDAADATVSVEQGDGVRADDAVGLRVNGKPDASSKGDLCTQLLVSHLPLIAKPESKEVFLLGLGSGISAGALMTHPIEHLTVGENCEPVIRAAKHFSEWNRGVLTNVKVKIWTEDARTILKLSPKKYDVIITQPSNPWTAGNGSVFSREFYELAKSRLNAGGIVSQWFHMYEMHDGIVALVLRTFGQVFPYLEIWDCGNGDVVILGANEPWSSSPQVYAPAFERAEVRSDLERIGIVSPEALWVRQLASQRTAFAIAGDGPVQTDLMPLLEYEAPRAFYIGTTANMLNDFDERTKQFRSAPPEKRAVLASLDDATVRSVFSKHGTVNVDLHKFLRWRLSSEKLIEDYKREFNAENLPCIFRVKPDSDSNAVAPDAGEDVKTLNTARSLIEKDRQFEEGVRAIESLLGKYDPGAKWSPAWYAAYAAETCFQQGNVERAKTFVKLGLKHRPQDVQLNFLARVLAGPMASN